jgi:hypothetical protein
LWYVVFIYSMDILITEEQLKRIITELHPLKKDEIESRLKMAKEIAKDYTNPRQFALDHKLLWNFIRSYNFVDEVFPNLSLIHI